MAATAVEAAQAQHAVLPGEAVAAQPVADPAEGHSTEPDQSNRRSP